MISKLHFCCVNYTFVLDKRNTAWLRDTVRQTSLGKSAAGADLNMTSIGSAVSPPCSITLDGNNLLTAEEIFAWPFYIKSPTIRLLYRPNHYVYLSPRENSVLSTSINTISLGQVPPNLRHSLSTVPSQSGTPFQPASQKLRHWPALNPSWPNLRDLAPRPLPPTRNTLVSAILYLEVSADYYSRSRSRLPSGRLPDRIA